MEALQVEAPQVEAPQVEALQLEALQLEEWPPLAEVLVAVFHLVLSTMPPGTMRATSNSPA